MRRRHFFDVCDLDSIITDEEGMELSTLDAVQEEAAQALADVVRDEVRAANSKGFTCDLAIDVRDDNGPVMRVKFNFNIERLQ
jgi:hypothetical protein